MRPLLNEIKKIPFARLVIPLILGILIAEKNNFSLQRLTIYLICVLTLVLSYSLLKKAGKVYRTLWIQGIFLNFLFFFMGIILTQNLKDTKQQLLENFTNQKFIYFGEIVDKPIEKNKSYKVNVQIIYCKNENAKSTGFNVLCYFENDSSVKKLSPGNIVIFESRLNPIKNAGNPYEFDYERHLAIQHVYLQTYIPTEKWMLSQMHYMNLKVVSSNIKNKIITILNELNLKSNNLEVLKALLVGEKTELDPETRNAYINSGTIHILSVSGLHVGIIYIMLNTILSFLRKNKFQIFIKLILILFVLWMYAIITGLAPSIQRATLMFSLILVGKTIGKEINSYNVLALSAFILIIINPFIIHNVGFQLSYMAVLSIMIFYSPIYSYLTTDNRFINYFSSLLCISLAAQILTFPIIIYYFNQFSTCFPIANIIIVPIVPLVMFGGIAQVIMSCSHLIIPLSVKVLDFLLSCMTQAALFSSNLPFSLIEEIRLHFYQVFFIYGFILLISLLFFSKKGKYLLFTFVLILMMLISTTFQKYSNISTDELYIYNIKGHSVINFKLKDESVTFCDKDFYMNSEWLTISSFEKQEINTFWNNNPQYLCCDTLFTSNSLNCLQLLKNSRLFVFKSKSVALIKENVNSTNFRLPDKKIHVDFIILSLGFRGSMNRLTDYFIFDTVIFDSSIPLYHENSLAIECKNLNIKYFEISKNGAVNLALN